MNCDYQPTFGCCFQSLILIVGSTRIILNVYDTIGGDTYQDLIPAFFREANAVIFVFDITNEESALDLPSWLKLIENRCGTSIQKFVTGNKMDLEKSIVIDDVKAKEFAEQHKSKFYLTSTKTGKGVSSMFYEIADTIIKSPQSSDEFQIQENSKQNCC
jgi:small GTP-binding protein